MTDQRARTFIKLREYAAQHLLKGINSVAQEVTELEAEVTRLVSESLQWEKDADFWNKKSWDNSSPLGDVYLAKAKTLAKESIQKENELEQAQKRMAEKQDALASLCSALLEIAKEGMSECIGSIHQITYKGRTLKGIAIADIIWQGRNQSMHFHETYHKRVQEVFKDLEQQYGETFSLQSEPRRSLARETISLLGWTDYQQFESDLMDLLSHPHNSVNFLLKELEAQDSYLFHGSGLDMPELEPRQAYNFIDGMQIKDGDPAIFATQFIDYAIFMALINQVNCPRSARSSASYENGDLHFGATEDTLAQLSEHSKGYVYAFDRCDFEMRNFFEWRCPKKLKPKYKFKVERADFTRAINVIEPA